MKLQSDMLHQFHLESQLGEHDIYEYVRLAIERDGRSMSQLQADCGFSHPRLADINYAYRGRRPGIATLLIALMEMGYEINIEKPSGQR
jgi:hypothetical protein